MSPELEGLVEELTPMAQSIARQIWSQAPHQLELSELQSLAYLGLCEAANMWSDYCERNAFDPSRYEYFKPYAQRRARGKILDTLRKTDHVQRSVRTKFKLLLDAGYGLGATMAELVVRTELPEQEIREVIQAAANKPVSLDDMEVDHSSRQDVEAEVQVSLFEDRLRKALVETVRSLPEPQQVVLALHYVKCVELRDVATMMGITESRASHLHTEAVLAVHEVLERVASEV